MKSRICRLDSLSLNDPLDDRGDVAALSARRRYKGQALLLAVLIMLLAALLGAGFLAVVSGNLNQSARIADKTRAIEASRAGIAFANAQLSGSSQGDLWRPIDVSPAPAPGSANPDYNYYYSQLDRVQGWANNLTPPDTSDTYPKMGYPTSITNYDDALAYYRNTTYGKFPDPTQIADDAPKFLVKVEEIPSLGSPSNPADPTALGYNAERAKHASEIKITSIGLSDDDPNVFHRAIAYKSGRAKSPWASASRAVSNWRFGDTAKNTGVPYATNPQIVGAATFPANNVAFTVDVADKPAFSDDDVPFNVVIIKKDAAPSVRGAVVTKVENNGAKLTFARLETTIGSNEMIQKAAAIGIGATIDLLNTGTPATFAADFPHPDGIVANGSIWLQGQIRLSNLSKNGAHIRISGALAIDKTDADKKPIAENSGDIGPTNTADATSNLIVASSQTNFPGNLVLAGAAQSNGVEKRDLVNDGWDVIGAQTLGLDYSKGRDVEPFTPINIYDAENLARYRALARDAARGIYLDNRADIERVGARAMTQRELVEMLLSPNAAPKDYERDGVAAVAAATDVSLEQRHLRGWVGPDEFLARGALVELIQNGAAPQLRITLDARSDANPSGPDATKTLHDGNDNLRPGIYTQVFPWPKNGLLLAEGNLRIRGNVQLPAPPTDGSPDPFPSLTVVSRGNIYIEGSLSVDNTTMNDPTDPALIPRQIPNENRKKLMLLARKNVIVNPTRAVIGRTDVQTIATNTAAVKFTGTTTAHPLSVANGLLFNQGDYVTIGVGQNKSVRGLITSVDAINNVVKISSKDIFTVPPATSGATFNVRSPLEARQAGDAPLSDHLFFSLVNMENAINRRVIAPIFTSKIAGASDPNRSKLVFDHVGELRQNGAVKEGLNIKAQDFDTAHPRPADFTAVLTNKQPLDSSSKLKFDQTDVQKADKFLRAYQNFSTPNLKDFNNFTPPAAKSLSQFAIEIGMTPESRELPTPAGYRFLANVTPALASLSTHALAGIGLRYEPGSPFTAPPDSADNQRRQDFNIATQPEGFTIPLATSVEYDLSGITSSLLPNTQARSTKYIGFNPGTGTTDNDDALTVDSSFYQLKTELFKSTLDARVFDAPVDSTGLTTLFSTQPPSIVLKRAFALSDAATSSLLPDYRVRAMKLENVNLNSQSIKPVTEALQINAFVYAQEGSWLIIPGDYFRSNPPVRGIADATGKIVGSYIDYNNSKTAQDNEYILFDPSNAASAKVADLNRNGKYDKGEIEAALRFVRYNTAPIRFYGAICENQTAIVADVAAVAMGAPPIVKGAVQDWTDKWATYDDTNVVNSEAGKAAQFKFISYVFDPSLLKGSVGANQLRVPVTNDLVYQE